LIELLVVIAIIALLLSILMPVLNTVKKSVQGILCASNVRQLSLGWFLYNEPNGGNLMRAENNELVLSSSKIIPPWAYQSEMNLIGGPDEPQVESDKVAIRRGALWPYVEHIKVYHCPADRVSRLGQMSANVYRSFSMPQSMNGDGNASGQLNPWQASKESRVKTPSAKMIFLTEFDVWVPGVMGNWGSWVMDYGNLGNFWDPIAVWHNNGGTLGFADGHAEMHKWRDRETLEMAKNFSVGNVSDPANNVDVIYMKNAYRATGRYKWLLPHSPNSPFGWFRVIISNA